MLAETEHPVQNGCHDLLATAGRAPILLADEPTKGLDTARRDQVVELLSRSPKAGGALLAITHEVFEGNVSEPETVKWVREINRHARRPDLTIVLDVSPEEAARRRKERSTGREIFDDPELQEQLSRFYADIEQHFPEDSIVHIDADRPVEAVAADVLLAVKRLRGEA